MGKPQAKQFLETGGRFDMPNMCDKLLSKEGKDRKEKTEKKGSIHLTVDNDLKVFLGSENLSYTLNSSMYILSKM